MTTKEEAQDALAEITDLCAGKWAQLPTPMYNDVVRGQLALWSKDYEMAAELLRPALHVARSLYSKERAR
jgi:hypothetical protein